jgi:superkiller protein 3
MFWKRAKGAHSSVQHFNQAADAWKKADRVFRRGRTRELDQLLVEVVQHCQLSLEADNRSGDAYVLLADALLCAAVSGESSPDDERYRYLTSRAAAVIGFWNDSPFKTYPFAKGKNAARGARVYELLRNIVAAEARGSTTHDADQTMKELASQLMPHVVSPSSFREIAQVIFAESRPIPSGNNAPDRLALPKDRENQGQPAPSRTKSDEQSSVYEEIPRILRCDMNTAEWHKCLGEAYNARYRFDDAIAEFKEALTIDANDAETHYLLALAYENRGDCDDAIEQYNNALRINPNHADARDGLEKAVEHRREAYEAIGQHREALRINPNNGEILLKLGFVYYEHLRKLDEATTEFKEALRADPDSAEAHLRLGNVYSDKGRIDEAIMEYREALRISPNYSVVRYNLGCSLADQGKLDDAIPEFKEALRIDPQNTTVRLRLAREYQAQEKLDQAIAEYRQALVVAPHSPHAHNGLGLAYQAQGKLDEAVSEFLEAAIEFLDVHLMGANLAQAYSNLGLAYMARGKFYEGMAQIRKALTIDANDAGAIYGLGIMFENRGRPQYAIRCYEVATKLASSLPGYAHIVREARNRISRLRRLA